jgi:hypothetical protein
VYANWMTGGEKAGISVPLILSNVFDRYLDGSVLDCTAYVERAQIPAMRKPLDTSIEHNGSIANERYARKPHSLIGVSSVKLDGFARGQKRQRQNSRALRFIARYS